MNKTMDKPRINYQASILISPFASCHHTMIPKPSENITNEEQVKKQPSPSPSPEAIRLPISLRNLYTRKTKISEKSKRTMIIFAKIYRFK